MRVELTQAALADLQAIGDWIALDNRARARTFVAELRTKILGLGQAPFAFPLVPELGTSVRKRLHRLYLIIYRVLDDRIEVLQVVHASRDYVRLLGPS